MLSPDAITFDITDEDFTSDREKNRILIYRALNTIQRILDQENESGTLSDYTKQNADDHISSIRAINLLLDIFPPDAKLESKDDK